MCPLPPILLTHFSWCSSSPDPWPSLTESWGANLEESMSTSIRQVGLSLGLWDGFGAQSFLFPETPSYVAPIHSPANPNARVPETLSVSTQFETLRKKYFCI